jgi:hypothetical protein
LNYATRGLGDFVGNALDSITSLNDFDVNKTATLQPFDIDQTFNLINQQISCSDPVPVGGLNSSVGVNGEVKVDVNVQVHAVVSLGVVATGTLVPPNVEDFGIMCGESIDINVTCYEVN